MNLFISRKLLVDIITERVKEIFELVKLNLVKQNIHGIINKCSLGCVCTLNCYFRVSFPLLRVKVCHCLERKRKLLGLVEFL